MRLDLAAVARLRVAGACDLNALAREDGGLAGFVAGDLAAALKAAWVVLGEPGPFAAWLKGLSGEDAARHRAALAAALAEFLPEPDDAERSGRAVAEAERKGPWVERLGWELAGLCGVDGSRLSLRELVWMARERRRFAGELAAWHLAGIVARMPFTAESLSPLEINPYKGPAPPKDAATAELERWQAEARLRALAGLEIKPLERK